MKKKFFGGILIILFVVTILMVKVFSQKGNLVDPLQYFDEFSSNQNNLVYEDKRIGLKEPALEIDGGVYVSYEFANESISDRIFYDQKEEVLTLTDDRNVLRIYKDKVISNGKKIESPFKVYRQNDTIYLPAEMLLERYGIEIKKGEDGRLFVATNKQIKQKTAIVRRNAYLTTHPQKKAVIIEKIERGDRVTIYGEEGKYTRVRSKNGIIGYIATSKLKDYEEIAPVKLQQVEPWPENPLGEKVRLVWDQMTVPVSDMSKKKYSFVDKANVISPTWFQFADNKGSLSDLGSRQYVTLAKQKGLQVWGLMSHNFSQPELTEPILNSTKNRQYVIDQLIKKAKKYGLDGINIDIENITDATSKEWVQFMRELYPQLKNAGIILSVDVYMPSNWSGHYEREKISEVCDYFIVMAYDQHWSGSDEAGSVSEIPWVEQGIQRNLEEVPKEKLVLGIPFYTRLWIQNNNGLSSEAYDMDSAKALVKTWGVTPVLDNASEQSYAELEKNNNVYRIWLEDENSIQKRLDLMSKYELAGYAAWKLGLESEDVWKLLEKIK